MELIETMKKNITSILQKRATIRFLYNKVDIRMSSVIKIQINYKEISIVIPKANYPFKVISDRIVASPYILAATCSTCRFMFG